MTPGPDGGLLLGRQPVQARARRTVDAILDAGADTLQASGAPLNLTAVAARAGVAIGSLYQYFPSAAALVHGLAERHLRTVGGRLVESVASPTVRPTSAALRAALLEYLAVADQPLEIAIMRAIRADPVLRRLDRGDTATNAARLVAALGVPARRAAAARARIEVIIELAGALALVLADTPPADRDRLVHPFLGMVLGDP